MKNLVIHGHFYQPPRENPWTGIIEDQKEASPHPNWNKRICSESYEPNAYSPLSNSDGKIVSFYNNYNYLSFNFGPTLIDWLKNESEHVYRKILEGDNESIQRLGHGNAMSQVYNHIILPLANENDRKTQILWGLENFLSHFKRDSLGMWLSETAIDYETARELVRSGMKYTVLSPWQVSKFRLEGSDWEDVNDYDPQIWQHPWKMTLPEGDLTVFFYHPHLSSEISFNHLLSDADNFYNRVTREMDETGSDLLSVGTDGEIYGHHEPLGNMGLSAFLNKIESSEDYRIVNFSWLYSNIKPAGHIELKPGEDERGSSWSCSHGVSRWYKDCGCSTGGEEGWNQSWRTPLREGLNDLALSSDRIYRSVMSRLTETPPEDVRNDYIHVITGSISTDEFFNKYCSRKSSSSKKQFFRLLEGQKYSMYMFTSCGWFFSDISGVEPLQNLMYAARLMDLYSPYYSSHPEGSLLEKLSHAQSNMPEKGNGAVLYTMSKYSKKNEIHQTAVSLILRHYYSIKEQLPGNLSGVIYPDNTSDEISFKSGTLELKFPLTGETLSIPYELTGKKRLFSQITLFPDENRIVYTPENLCRLDKEELMKQLCLMELENNQTISKKYSGIINQLDEWMKLKLPEGEDLKKSIKALLHYAFREVTFLMESGNSEGWNSYMNLQKKNRYWKIPLPEDMYLWLNRIIDKELLNPQQIVHMLEAGKGEILNKLVILLDPQNKNNRKIITPTLSGRIFELITSNKQGLELMERADPEVRKRLLELLNLSEKILISDSGVFQKPSS